MEMKDKIIERDFSFLSKIIRETLITKIKFFKDDVREKKSKTYVKFWTYFFPCN